MFFVLIGLLSAASSDYTYGRRVHEVHLPEIYVDTRSPAGRTLLSEIVGFGRPMPQVASAHVLVTVRRLTKSSRLRGMRNERPAGSPLDDEG